MRDIRSTEIIKVLKANIKPYDPDDDEQMEGCTDTTSELKGLGTFLDGQETENKDDENAHLEPGNINR